MSVNGLDSVLSYRAVGKKEAKMVVKVYSFGSNGNYQLGFPHGEDLMVPQLTYTAEDEHVKKVVCGGNHTVMMMTSGRVLVAGSNEMGQLSGKECNAVVEWQDVDDTWQFEDPDETIVDISCGWEFTAVVTSSNKVYVRGNGPKGELGFGSDILRSSKFLHVFTATDPKDKVQIFTSFQNCVVLVTNPKTGTKIYGWGSNTKCQLWSPKCKVVSKPSIIYENPDINIDYVSMGKDFIVYVDDKGSIVHTTGNIPKTFNFDDWSKKTNLQVLTMWSSIHIIERDNRLQISSYGFNMHKQLFDNSYIKDVDNVLDVEVGSEHGILTNTTSEGTTYDIKCWGWGEHGNCGTLYEDDKEIINDRSNEISPLNQVMSFPKLEETQIGIYGGCANTWIVIDQ